jgi:hypothetical protein
MVNHISSAVNSTTIMAIARKPHLADVVNVVTDDDVLIGLYW